MVASYSDRTRNFAVHSRRKFLTQAGVLAAGTMGAPALPEAQRWYGTNDSINAWRKVRVPHTWQVDSAFIDYRGVAWYRRTFDALSEWQNSAVRIEFEAVFHTATIWVNGELAGQHVRKGYTAFVLDITQQLRWGSSNTIAVRVDNA